MKFKILTYLLVIITGVLIKIYGVGVNKDMESLFSLTIIALGVLNIIYEISKLIIRENLKRKKE